MKFSVVILRQAEQDFQSIYQYVSERSKRGAGRWVETFSDALARLETDAMSYGLAPESSGRKLSVRQMLFKTRSGNPYRVLYSILDETVYIRTIRGLGQEFAELDDIELPPAVDTNLD